MIYAIYHAVSDKRFTETLDQPRVFVGTVDARSLQDAYNKSQNVHESWNMSSPCRSTSVGDAICSTFNGMYFMVSGTGFRTLGKDMKISKPNTLKTELEQLYNLARKVADYFDDKRLVTMSVILQNMAFRADVAKESDFSEQLEILRLNSEFRTDCHTSDWFYREADMIVTGYFMSDAMDEESADRKISAKVVEESYEDYMNRMIDSDD